MSETLVIGGKTYTGVEGIKATDSLGNTVTYTSGGSEPTAIDLIKATATHFSDPTLTSIRSYSFNHYPTAFTVDFPNVTYIGAYALQYSHIQTQMWPKLKKLEICSFADTYDLEKVILPVLESGTGPSGFIGCTKLTIVDGSFTAIDENCFRSCGKLATLVMRNTSLVPLNSLDSIINTPFYQGKAGGDIYIPKALYDHLGDGTASDYKAATNWSTYDSYGTITWHPIEGSIYETQYADGTPIT